MLWLRMVDFEVYLDIQVHIEVQILFLWHHFDEFFTCIFLNLQLWRKFFRVFLFRVGIEVFFWIVVDSFVVNIMRLFLFLDWIVTQITIDVKDFLFGKGRRHFEWIFVSILFSLGQTVFGLAICVKSSFGSLFLDQNGRLTLGIDMLDRTLDCVLLPIRREKVFFIVLK